MAAAATGKSYVRELRQRVFGPLRLHHTSLPRGAALPAPYIHGYDVAPPQPPTDVSHLFAAGWAWASGGIVSTPRDANTFIRAYVRGATTSPSARRAQFTFRAGSSSRPTRQELGGPGDIPLPDPVRNGVRTYRKWRPGYTQFVAASKNGKRSVVVSVNAQITPDNHPARFRELRQIDTLAVCAALAR